MMSENGDRQQGSPDAVENERQYSIPGSEPDAGEIFVEIPASPQPAHPERVPSVYDPMGEVHLRGRVYGSLASGSIPWWVLISGWVVFGSFAFVILLPIVFAKAFELLPILALVSLPLVVLWRGTTAKRSGRNRRD